MSGTFDNKNTGEKLVAAFGGYTTGWNESQRNIFSIGALCTVIMGVPIVPIEAAELAAHITTGKREMFAKNISVNGDITGFYTEIYPYIGKAINLISERYPKYNKYFQELVLTQEWKNMLKVNGPGSGPILEKLKKDLSPTITLSYSILYDQKNTK